MLDQLKQLPPRAIAMLALIGGVVFLYVTMPPKSLCESQSEVFKTAQTPFLFLNPKKPYIKTVGFLKSVETCKQSNSHGGCGEMFEGLENFFIDFKIVDQECRANVYALPQVSGLVTGSIQLMIKLAWTEKAPKSVFERSGWFDQSHLRTFCNLKKIFTEFSGEESWNELANQTLLLLPQSDQLDRKEAWARSLMSTPCSN